MCVRMNVSFVLLTQTQTCLSCSLRSSCSSPSCLRSRARLLACECQDGREMCWTRGSSTQLEGIRTGVRTHVKAHRIHSKQTPSTHLQSSGLRLHGQICNQLPPSCKVLFCIHDLFALLNNITHSIHMYQRMCQCKKDLTHFEGPLLRPRSSCVPIHKMQCTAGLFTSVFVALSVQGHDTPRSSFASTIFLRP